MKVKCERCGWEDQTEVLSYESVLKDKIEGKTIVKETKTQIFESGSDFHRYMKNYIPWVKLTPGIIKVEDKFCQHCKPLGNGSI